MEENLRNWFKKEKWVRIDTQGNIAGKCGTMKKGKKTQRCLPLAKARSLTKKQRAATSRKKTRSKKQFVKNTKAAKVRLKKENMDKKDLKSLILKTLEKEGGAAGIKALTKAVKMSKKNLEKDLNKMSGVKQHKHGDYISTPLNEAVKEILKIINEELCPAGKAYRKRRMAAGEKSSAYLSGRAVKVCKGQMSGKKKKKKKNEDALNLSKQNMSSYSTKNEAHCYDEDGKPMPEAHCNESINKTLNENKVCRCHGQTSYGFYGPIMCNTASHGVQAWWASDCCNKTMETPEGCWVSNKVSGGPSVINLDDKFALPTVPDTKFDPTMSKPTMSALKEQIKKNLKSLQESKTDGKKGKGDSKMRYACASGTCYKSPGGQFYDLAACKKECPYPDYGNPGKKSNKNKSLKKEEKHDTPKKYPAEVDGEKTEVTFRGFKDNDDDEISVQVNWENESYDLTFILDSEGTDHGTEGSDATFVAKSKDGKWVFEMEVYLNRGHGSGQCNPCIGDYPMDMTGKGVYLNIMKAENPGMDKLNEAHCYDEDGKPMPEAHCNEEKTEVYSIESVDEIKMIEDALNEEELGEGRKKGKCKPAKGKRFAKRVNGKCRSFGQKGKASDGGDRIRPGTKKAHAYCARSAKIKKCKNPPCANTLSRRKWKCQGSRSVPESVNEIKRMQKLANILK